VACKVAPGISEATQLHSIFVSAREMDIAAVTAPARSYVASEHSPDRIAQRLASLLQEAAVSLRAPMQRWNNFYSNARAELLREVAELMGSSADAGLAPFSRVMSPAVDELFSR
jgi:hypothetical protein